MIFPRRTDARYFSRSRNTPDDIPRRTRVAERFASAIASQKRRRAMARALSIALGRRMKCRLERVDETWKKKKKKHAKRFSLSFVERKFSRAKLRLSQKEKHESCGTRARCAVKGEDNRTTISLVGQVAERRYNSLSRSRRLPRKYPERAALSVLPAKNARARARARSKTPE